VESNNYLVNIPLLNYYK